MSRRRVNHKREINGIIYLMAALILAAAYYLPEQTTGWLGSALLHLGRGLIGTAAFVFPAILLYMAIDYFLEKQVRITRRRFTYVLLFLVGAATLVHAIAIDQSLVRQLSAGSDGQPQAMAAMKILWQGGLEPSVIGQSGDIWSGGLIGGMIAQAMSSIAGEIGSYILIAAFLLAQLVLLLNVSLSRAVNKTANVIHKTGKHVDQAVRTSVVNIRQARAAELADRQSYDLDLEKVGGNERVQSPESSSDDEDAEPVKYSLRATLKKLFGPRQEKFPTLTQEELSVPEFLSEEQQGADGPTAAFTGTVQRSPYDMKIDKDHAEIQNEAPAEPAAEELPDLKLPAGVHRIEKPQTDDVSDKAAQTDSDRTGWLDRTEGTDAPVLFKTSDEGSGSQLAMDIPYKLPPIHLLREDRVQHNRGIQRSSIQALGQKLEKTLESFGIKASVVHVTHGPTITRFELSPGPGVKVSRIVGLADDIALNLAAMGVRIEAPIPGKAAIGIEIPNKETSPVLLRGIIESSEFKSSRSPLAAAVGRDIQGNPMLCDIAKMPHLLIAGATGSGKSVCINSILMSILYRSNPNDVKMMMIDPKVVELNVYNGIPHLLAPVVTDPKKAANTLLWAVNEMTRRYGLFAEKSVRDINSYNDAARSSAEMGDEEFEKLPLILFVIDELSDLMATAPNEVEDAIARLTAMARAAGIHLIIATQRPSVDVITGVIKANIPSRIAFAVASQVDSRTILDMGGAEKLLGKGDMLYYPQSASKPVRGQGAFVTDAEVERVLRHIKSQHAADYDQKITDAIMTATPINGKTSTEDSEDELLPQALEVIVETGYASVSLLQRRMKLGYPRAARLIDALHEQGFVGPFEGSKPRKLLISQAQYLELKAKEEN